MVPGHWGDKLLTENCSYMDVSIIFPLTILDRIKDSRRRYPITADSVSLKDNFANADS